MSKLTKPTIEEHERMARAIHDFDEILFPFVLGKYPVQSREFRAWVRLGNALNEYRRALDSACWGEGNRKIPYQGEVARFYH
jgi:hypothetical protein